MRRWHALALLAPAALGCGAPAVREPLTLMVLGAEEHRGRIEAAATGASDLLDVAVASAPARTTSSSGDGADDAIARARAAYEGGDYEACLERLGGEPELDAALGASQRERAARLLWWRAACQRALGGAAGAEPALRALAALELPRPPGEVDLVSSGLDVQLTEVRAALEAGGRVRLRVETEPAARVSIDGGVQRCATSPCEREVLPGAHVVRVEASGRVPSLHRATVGASPEVMRLELDPATPELAAEQWAERFGDGVELDGAESLALLRLASRAERLVVVLTEPESAAVRLRAALVSDEGVTGRAERRPSSLELEAGARQVLFELAPWARPREFWETPWPWIALAAVLAGAGAGLVYYYAAPVDASSRLTVSWTGARP